MSNFFEKLQKLLSLNINTIRFNFKYFPFKQAIKFPVLLSSNVLLLKMSGKFLLSEPLYYGKVKIGYGEVGIFDQRFSRSIWEVKGAIEFKGNANIGHGSKICVGEKGRLVLGSNFTISAESTIIAFNNISIGNNCLISWDTLIADTDFHKIKDADNTILNNSAPVILHDKVWVGARCLILKGAVIPSNSVVAAGSTVSRKLVGANQIFAGAPAKAVKSEITWEH